MKLNYEYGDGFLRITKTYEPGEKYISGLRWNSSNGKITKEKVKSMVPGAKFIKSFSQKGISCHTLGPTRWTTVLIERTFHG